MIRNKINESQMKHYPYIFLLVTLLISGNFGAPLIYATSINDPGDQDFLTELRLRGYSLIPAPQEVDLGEQDVILDESWSVSFNMSEDNIAVKRLIDGAEELHQLTFDANGSRKIVLSVQSGVVRGNDDPALNDQGYLLRVASKTVEIIGNSNTGLFYGVQSFLQLLRRNSAGQLTLPESEIRDWPSLQLRFVHWDTKHHQKRMETMKRLIDWHAFFKVNMIAFEMEDKYEYPSHPVIGAPEAYTKAEMEELTRYARDRYIQIVPNVQSPAHMTYVLKHKEFAHLRSDGSNYQICMCDPASLDLIFDMYQDMIDATPGVEYFLVSTDEVYYAGICSKCKDEYNEENRSKAWVDFATKAHDWLAQRGRRMIAWVEYPLLPEHISLVPPDIINGVMGSNKEFLNAQKKIGMRQLAYSSTQGAEWLFPNHFPTQYRNRNIEGRLYDISTTVREGLSTGANPIGTFAAAWDDSGLHEETFHLGWATVAQYGWTPYGPSVEQNVADFMDVFYGVSSPDMTPVYQDLLEGARLYERGWDVVPSTERETGYGNSYGKGIGSERIDEQLTLPEIPEGKTLKRMGKFSDRYATLISDVEKLKPNNDHLLYRLNRYIGQVERNRYNLEVFLSIAYLERYFIKTVLSLRDAERYLLQAETNAAENNPSIAVANLVEASNKVGDLIAWGDWMWQNLTETWEKSRYPKNRDVDEQEFLHVMDDVKDHIADRRKGLDYMIAPFQRLNLTDWRSKINEIISEYAMTHNVSVSGLTETRLED